jgi:DNA topoisomerase IA
MSMASSAEFQDQAEATRLADTLSDNDLVVIDRQIEVIVEPAPAPYTTADLLGDAITRFEWSGDQVMKIAQEIFEAGWITYPRTDSQRLEPDAQTAIRDAVSAIYGPDMLGPLDGGIISTMETGFAGWRKVSTTPPAATKKSRLVSLVERFLSPSLKMPVFKKQPLQKPPVKNTRSGAAATPQAAPENNIEDAHEAIRPTDPAQEPQSLDASEQQKQLYEIIWQRTLASQMKPARYRRITVAMEVAG